LKNIVLIGFMGTGKTTVGKALSKKTGLTLVDVDLVIEEHEKRRIADIFEKDGETAFRKLEKEAIGKIASAGGQIITTGGGAVLDPENFQALKKNGLVIALEAEPETIYERVRGSRHRPLLKSGDVQSEIKRLLESRKSVYDKADLKFSTGGKSAQQVADEIAAAMSKEEDLGSGKDRL
jgi:shikimate kinase